MSTHSQASLVIDCCLTAASHCVERGNHLPDRDFMKSKFREAAMEVSCWGLSGPTKAGLILRPMERRLVRRHGPLVGREIYWEFVDAFWLQSWTNIPLEPERLARTVEQTREWHWRLMAHRSMKRLLCFSQDPSETVHRD